MVPLEGAGFSDAIGKVLFFSDLFRFHTCNCCGLIRAPHGQTRPKNYVRLARPRKQITPETITRLGKTEVPVVESDRRAPFRRPSQQSGCVFDRRKGDRPREISSRARGRFAFPQALPLASGDAWGAKQTGSSRSRCTVCRTATGICPPQVSTIRDTPLSPPPIPIRTAGCENHPGAEPERPT